MVCPVQIVVSISSSGKNGSGTTTTLTWLVAVHPLTPVAVTVYTVVSVGFATGFATGLASGASVVAAPNPQTVWRFGGGTKHAIAGADSATRTV